MMKMIHACHDHEVMLVRCTMLVAGTAAIWYLDLRFWGGSLEKTQKHLYKLVKSMGRKKQSNF